MLNNVHEPEERRLVILEGINHDLNSSEIAAKLGVERWIVRKDLKSMKYNRDPELIRAYKDQFTRAIANKRSASKLSDERFHTMTGMTFQEKTFDNMMNFYRPELIRVIESRDETVAITNLDKSIQRVLKHNDIISGGKNRRRITSKARAHLPHKTGREHKSR